METETLNMLTATIPEITSQIERQLRDGDYTPVILIGKTGVGKSESIRDLAERLGIGFKELRLSHYQESDLIGLPYIDEKGITRHAPSDLLPDEKDKKQGILMLDEVTSAPRSMRSAVYQLLDSSRSLGRYHLPKKWMVVACGNGPDDGGDFRGIEPAFLSRGFCWRIEENFRVWKKWALEHDIHPVVTAFLSFKPEYLHVMNPERSYDMIACPRNWVKLSTELKNMEKRFADGVIDDENLLEFAVDGCIGCQCGQAFTTFYKFRSMLINPEEIMAGKVPAAKMKKVKDEVLYMTAQALVKAVADDIASNISKDGFSVSEDCLQRVANACSWIMDIGAKVRLDTAISMIRDMTVTVGSSFNTVLMSDEFDSICPGFTDFAVENRAVFGE